MYTIVPLIFLLFNISYAINTKQLSKPNLKKSYQESYLCQIIKQRQREHVIHYGNQISNSKVNQPYKPLYIPESKNCR
jgi:hypothetical protein